MIVIFHKIIEFTFFFFSNAALVSIRDFEKHKKKKLIFVLF